MVDWRSLELEGQLEFVVMTIVEPEWTVESIVKSRRMISALLWAFVCDIMGFL
jgi:hypothetical protein